MPENGGEFGNGDDEREYGELDDLRDLLDDRYDDVENMVLLDLGDGEGFANVEIDGQWYGFDLQNFDDSIWEEFFDYLDEYDIEYVVYE